MNWPNMPPAEHPTRSWWQHHARALAMTAGMVASAVVGIGLATGIRATMHTILLVVGVAAFFPFIIVGALLALVVLAIVVAAIAEADLSIDVGVEAAVDAPVDGSANEGPPSTVLSSLFSGYYRFLGRRRHPVFWGIPLGMLMGAFVCWIVLGLTVVPKEIETAQQLEDVRKELESKAEIPKPDAAAQLRMQGEIVTDGFGHPVRYETRGRWKLQVWTARSAGADGVFGTPDDLCISGRTELVGKLAELAEKRLHARALSKQLGTILSMRCERIRT